MVHDVGKWEPITIQVLTRTQDALGGIVEAWATHLNCYAKVSPFSGKEFFYSDKKNIKKSARFFTYYIPNLNEKDYRIVYEGDYYDIVYLSVLNRRESMEIVGEVVR